MAITQLKPGQNLRVRENKKSGRWEVYRKGHNKVGDTVFNAPTEEDAWHWVLVIRNYPFKPPRDWRAALNSED